MDEATQRSYAEAGLVAGDPRFGERPVLVVVDMCQAYFTAGSPLDLDQPDVVASVASLVTSARAAHVPVIWTRVEFDPKADDNGIWYERLSVLRSFDRGNGLGDWIEGLRPAAGDVVVTKQHASGFFGTDLALRLESLRADSVIIAGVSTSGCVRATATDASAHGFAPTVVRQAVGDRTAAVHDANLFDLAAKYADVVDLDDVIRQLESLDATRS